MNVNVKRDEKENEGTVATGHRSRRAAPWHTFTGWLPALALPPATVAMAHLPSFRASPRTDRSGAHTLTNIRATLCIWQSDFGDYVGVYARVVMAARSLLLLLLLLLLFLLLSFSLSS